MLGDRLLILLSLTGCRRECESSNLESFKRNHCHIHPSTYLSFLWCIHWQKVAVLLSTSTAHCCQLISQLANYMTLYQTSQLTWFDCVTHRIQYVITVSWQGHVFTQSDFLILQTPALSPYYRYGLVSICTRCYAYPSLVAKLRRIWERGYA